MLALEYISVTALQPLKRNARTHSRKQIRQIADSIRTFGFTNPILIDRDNMILAGHGRVEAAKLLGMSEVPCVRLENMTPAQKRAYALADNKLALNAGWDEDLPAEELQALLERDVEFDIAVLPNPASRRGSPEIHAAGPRVRGTSALDSTKSV